MNSEIIPAQAALALHEAADRVEDALYDGIAMRQVTSTAEFAKWLRQRAGQYERLAADLAEQGKTP